MTLQDLQKKEDKDFLFKNNVKNAQTQSEKWGIKALELTNLFRKSTEEGH